MSNLIPYLALDVTGSSPDNLVSNEEQLLLQVSGVSYPVVVLNNGGFYTRGLQVFDENLKVLTPDTDYIATYKHADASAYTGLEICSAIVILNTALKNSVYVTAQMVGEDLAYSLSVREDTLAYLRSLGTIKPVWGGFVGEEPLWEDGQLRRDRWALKGIVPFVFSLSNIAKGMKQGDPAAEDAFRKHALDEYTKFMAGFVDHLTPHLRDKSNPHADIKNDIGLGLVNNFPLATVAQAQAGASNSLYMSPALFYKEADALALPPLNTHVNDHNNPHGETAAMLGIYTQAEVNALAASKFRIGATALNSNALQGRSWPVMYEEIRANLDTSFFTTGIFSQERLGVGAYSSEYVLRGDGQWVNIRELFAQYKRGGGTKVFYIGQFNDYNSVLQNVNATFADATAYPVGTIIIWRYYHLVYIAYGNGVGSASINPTRGIVRTASGWIHLTTDATQASGLPQPGEPEPTPAPGTPAPAPTPVAPTLSGPTSVQGRSSASGVFNYPAGATLSVQELSVSANSPLVRPVPIGAGPPSKISWGLQQTNRYGNYRGVWRVTATKDGASSFIDVEVYTWDNNK